MRNPRSTVALAFALLLPGLAACDGDSDDMLDDDGASDTADDETTASGGDEGAETGAGTGTGGDVEPGTPAAAISRGYQAPRSAHDIGENAVFVAVSAVYAASIQGAGGTALLTTGTLTENADGSFTYGASPSDKMVIDWRSGPDTELRVDELDGYFEAETVEEFLAAPHELAIRYVREGEGDATVTSSDDGNERSASLVGTVSIEGVAYEVNLTEAGESVFDAAEGTASYEATSVMTGTIVGPGFHLEAQESFWATSIFNDELVTNKIREASSTFVVDGEQYVFDGLYVRQATVDGWPDNRDDYWHAEGTIIVGGAAVGELILVDTESRIDIVLDTTEGRTVLESHIYPQ